VRYDMTSLDLFISVADERSLTRAARIKHLAVSAVSKPGVHVIDCPVDYSENDFILNSELKRRSALV